MSGVSRMLLTYSGIRDHGVAPHETSYNVLSDNVLPLTRLMHRPSITAPWGE